MFVFQFPFPFARLIGCLTRSVRFDLQRLRCSPLSLSFSLPFIMQSANLSNRLQIDKLSTAISVFVSPNSSSSLWAPHAFKATLQMLCFCVFFIRFLKRVWPHEQRLYWSLAWYMAYGIRTTSTQHIQLLIGKSIDQLCRQRVGATSLTVSELGSSYEIFSKKRLRTVAEARVKL